MPVWLRWLLVLPAALGACVGIQIVVIFGNLITWPDSIPFRKFFIEIINSIAANYCFVIIGAKTAPKHRFVVGVILATAYTVFGITVAATFLIIGGSPYLTWWPIPITSVVLLLIVGIVGIIAAIGACIQLHRTELAERSPELSSHQDRL